MKQFLRKTFLTLVGAVLFSATSLGTTITGTGFLSQVSSQYTIAPNKTFTISFTSSTGSTNIWNAWVTVLKPTDTTFNNDDTSTFYTLLRADVYGWGTYYDATKISGSAPAGITNAANTSVTLTVVRKGSLVQTYVKAENGTNTYYQYYHNNIGDGTQDIGLLLSIDNATLEISSDGTTTDTTEELNHLYVGNNSNTTPFWSAFSDSYILTPNNSLKLRFKNYSSKTENYHNWVTFVTNDVNRNDTDNGYTEYIGLRADNWESIQNANTGITSNFNWETFKNDMDGATVTLTVTRSMANVTVRCDIVPAGGGSYYEEFTKACGDGTQNIRVFLAADHSHFDILPETATISDVAWSTFASDYNLDFSQAESGLTAYAVTGHSGTAITKEAVTGIVPAGTPLLLNGTASTSYTIPVATSAGTAPTGNKLVRGADAAVSATSGNTTYVLSKDGTKAVFKKIESTSATVAKNQAYLLFNEVIAARSIDIDGDGTTGIQNLKVGKEDNVYYDLQGRRVLYPKKGLYIVNGKKVIINK